MFIYCLFCLGRFRTITYIECFCSSSFFYVCKDNMYFEIFQIILQENVKSTLHFWLLSQTNSQKAVFYQFVSRFKPKHILVVFDSLFLT